METQVYAGKNIATYDNSAALRELERRLGRDSKKIYFCPVCKVKYALPDDADLKCRTPRCKGVLKELTAV